MDQIDHARQRLESATGISELLDAGWDAFGVLAEGCQRGQDGTHELFAAYGFAVTAATQGRIAIATAPSLPDGRPDAADQPERSVADDPDRAARALAGLAGLLRQRLAAAARQAGDSADGQACADAAQYAATVHELLAAGP
jgi:hypothetical protein